jgi:hypothetical protein
MPWGQIYGTLGGRYRGVYQGSALRGFPGNSDVGVVAMKRFVVVVVGLLGAIVAGGAGWSF